MPAVPRTVDFLVLNIDTYFNYTVRWKSSTSNLWR